MSSENVSHIKSGTWRTVALVTLMVGEQIALNSTIALCVHLGRE